MLFLGHARGSDCEFQTQLVIAENLGFGSAHLRTSAADEVSRMLVAMMRKQKRDSEMGGAQAFPNP